MNADTLKDTVIASLEELKAQAIQAINVKDVSSVTDYMIVASATSNRHAKSCAERVIEDIKAKNLTPIGIEGQDKGEWVLVDLGDVVLHIMLEEVRSFYDIESLWTISEKTQERFQQ